MRGRAERRERRVKAAGRGWLRRRCPALISTADPAPPETPTMTAPPTIVFDTDCVLCSGMVRFVLAHERDRALRFAGAWSEEGSALAAHHGFTRDDLNATFLVVEGDRALTRSDAAFAILTHLRAPWRWLGPARAVPRPLRDGVYDLVARHRYRLFGRKRDCTVVPSAERHRFVGVKGGTQAGA